MCTVLEGKLELLEHEAAKWLKREELDSVNWLPADVELVEILKDRWENRNASSFSQGIWSR